MGNVNGTMYVLDLPASSCLTYLSVLNVDQFQRFMDVIRRLGDRVEKEHHQFLRDSQRLEDRSSVTNGATGPQSHAVAVDFESLVGGGGGAATTSASTNGVVSSKPTNNAWDDDVWGSIFNDDVSLFLAIHLPGTHLHCRAQSLKVPPWQQCQLRLNLSIKLTSLSPPHPDYLLVTPPD